MLKCFFSEKVNAEVLVCISFFFENEVCISYVHVYFFFFFGGESHNLYVYFGSEGKLEMAKHILYKKNYGPFFIMYNGNFCEISLYLFLV